MKKYFVFINDSAGELDWISEYIVRSDKIEWEVYLNFPNKNDSELEELWDKYFYNYERIKHIKRSNFLKNLSRVDFLFDSVVRYLGRFSKSLSRYAEILFNSVRYVVSYFIFLKEFRQYDFIFRDYNLRNTFALEHIIRNQNEAKIVIFPHSTAIISTDKRTLNQRKKPLKVKCDYFLENSKLSNYFDQFFVNKVFYVGSPSIDAFRSRNKVRENSILFITRNCDPDFFGFNLEDALQRFEMVIKKFHEKKIRVYVKHHPRDPKINEWRKIQGKYSSCEEISGSINSFNIKPTLVFSFYSSLGVLFSSVGVPVFDISPYKNFGKKLPYHFACTKNILTTELVEKGMMDQLNNDEKIILMIERFNEIKFDEKGLSQKDNIDKYFPKNACVKIQELLDK